MLLLFYETKLLNKKKTSIALNKVTKKKMTNLNCTQFRKYLIKSSIMHLFQNRF